MAKIGINLKDGTIDNESEIIVGIDLGTTNSLVAYTDDNGNPFVVTDQQNNQALTPSVLYFDPNNHIIVGEKAVAQLELSPERTIYSVKRLMGKSYEDIKSYQSQFGYRVIDNEDSLVKIEVDNIFYTPIELSAEILKSLKSRVEQELQSTISKCVITVPAYFNDAQRQATRDAGRLAGMDVLRIINEPTAAALAYGVGLKMDEHKIVAVYDLGGGTFDISILAIEDRVFEVLSTHGDTFLGGDDFDRAIIQHWIDTQNIDKSRLDEDKSFGQQIRLEAEKAKKHLSNHSFYKSSIQDLTLELSLTIFNELIQGLIDKTLSSCQRALDDAGLSVEDIDDVILVGGSTRVDLVKSSVDSFFNKNANNSLNPDEVVALGAAIQASILSGKQKDMLLLDITPLSLGIETVGGLMDVIISRNSKVPNAMAREYTTSVDGQKNLKISVYQGERDLVEHNRKLGEFILSNIPPMPAGIPKIQVKFMLDADGILTVSAKELRSEVEQRIIIKSQYGISEEDMGRMLMDSIQNAESDLKKKALVDAINEAKSILVNGKRFLKQNKDWLSMNQVNHIEKLFGDLEKLIQKDDKNLIHSKMEEINVYTRPLAEEAMNQTIKNSLSGTTITEKDLEEE